MRKSLVAVALLGATLFLSACDTDDREYDGGPAVTEGRVWDKGIHDGCNRLTLARTDKVWNKKTKHYESKVAIGYICIPRPAWDDIQVGQLYEVPKP